MFSTDSANKQRISVKLPPNGLKVAHQCGSKTFLSKQALLSGSYRLITTLPSSLIFLFFPFLITRTCAVVGCSIRPMNHHSSQLYSVTAVIYKPVIHSLFSEPCLLCVVLHKNAFEEQIVDC